MGKSTHILIARRERERRERELADRRRGEVIGPFYSDADAEAEAAFTGEGDEPEAEDED